MKILIILVIFLILSFLVIFSFCACVLAHDADQHLEMMNEVIFNSNKENEKMEEKIEDDFDKILTALKFGKKWKISGKNGFLVNYRENDVIFLWDEENCQWTISIQKIVK